MIILARLLSPLDFGILGLAIFSANILNVFSETGIESALIQRDKIGRAELDTAWTIKVIRGLVLFMLLFASAGFFASYFDNVTLKPVLRIMAISFLLRGWDNIGIVLFQKNLEFKKKVILESAADVGGATVAVLLAFWLRNVWALVAGSIVWGILKCLGSYRLHSYRPRIRWDWRIIKDLMSFGKHMFCVSLITFVVTSGDNAIVGKVLGLAMLGFYTMAYNIANIPVSGIASVIGKISFPAYSILRKEPERLKEAFGKVFEGVMIILLPLTGVIFLLAHDFTMVCLGKKWLPMVPAVKVLCLLGLFRGLINILAAIHLAVNRPDIQSRNKTIELVAFLALVYPLTLKWGLIGSCWGVTMVYALSALINAIDTSRLLQRIWIIMARALVFPLTILAILLVTVWGMTSYIPCETDQWRFFLSSFLCFVAYGGTLGFFKRQFLRDVLNAL